MIINKNIFIININSLLLKKRREVIEELRKLEEEHYNVEDIVSIFQTTHTIKHHNIYLFFSSNNLMGYLCLEKIRPKSLFEYLQQEPSEDGENDFFKKIKKIKKKQEKFLYISDFLIKREYRLYIQILLKEIIKNILPKEEVICATCNPYSFRVLEKLQKKKIVSSLEYDDSVDLEDEEDADCIPLFFSINKEK